MSNRNGCSALFKNKSKQTAATYYFNSIYIFKLSFLIIFFSIYIELREIKFTSKPDFLTWNLQHDKTHPKLTPTNLLDLIFQSEPGGV